MRFLEFALYCYCSSCSCLHVDLRLPFQDWDTNKERRSAVGPPPTHPPPPIHPFPWIRNVFFFGWLVVFALFVSLFSHCVLLPPPRRGFVAWGEVFGLLCVADGVGPTPGWSHVSVAVWQGSNRAGVFLCRSLAVDAAAAARRPGSRGGFSGPGDASRRPLPPQAPPPAR